MKYIIGNWKCNPAKEKEARELFDSLTRNIPSAENVETVICPPFVYLPFGKGLVLGAQDCFWEQKGAYTGEISPVQLKDLGCRYVIIGHSERRKYQKESDVLNKKIKAAISAGLVPVFCIEKESQIQSGLKGLLKPEIERIIVAFEPVSAIGTGKPYGAREAKKMLDKIKEKVSVPVLYGGSVNSSNAKDYFDVGYDGLLVGGASLEAVEFLKIAKLAQG
jgi:triosephosphate isomerase